MITVLRRTSSQTAAQLVLLLVALSAFITGLSRVVRGAETSAFIPAAFPAVLLGWWLGRSSFKAWKSLSSLMVLGALLLWGRTAQLGATLLEFSASVTEYLLQNFFYIHGGPLPLSSKGAAEAVVAFQDLLLKSSAVWQRVETWLAGLLTGENINDPVVLVLFWSLLLWMLSGWAGWATGRNRVLAGLVPCLAVLAAVTQYTNSDVVSLWLMTVSTIGLMSVARFDANFRRWISSQVDYAELIITNTMISVVFIALILAALGWVLPLISVKDILEEWRRHDAAESQTVQSLGLEAAREPLPTAVSVPISLRAPGLPNNHLLGTGPELSRDVVFTVRTGELSPVPDPDPYVAAPDLQASAPYHYWRSLSFDVYTGTGWVSSQVESTKIPAGELLFAAPPGYRLLKQNFELKNGDEGSLYWSGTLARSNMPFDAAWRIPPGQSYPLSVDPFGGADLYGAVNSTSVYDVESFIPQVSEAQLRAAGRQVPDFIKERYTRLPSGVPERIYALSRELTSVAADPYDEAKAIEGYLRLNYPYTLDVSLPPAGVDVVDYFLFDLKKGYCDYYATAMVVMARSVGLPARLVTGYASGTYDFQAAEYIVSAADAHAWVEIYFPGIGWLEFEPTAGRPEINHPVQDSELAGSEPAPAQRWEQFIRSIYQFPPVTRWLFFALLGLLGLLVLFFLIEGWLLGLVRPAFAMRWMYHSIYRQAERLSGSGVPGQTASEFAENLQEKFKTPDSRLNLLTGFYLRVLFSPRPLQKAEIYQAIKAWRGLRWKLFWTRIKGSKA